MTKLHTMENISANGSQGIQRLKVPSGWLYIVTDYSNVNGVSTTFVPDSEGTKEVAPKDHPLNIKGHPGAYRFERHDGTWSMPYISVDSCRQGYEFEYAPVDEPICDSDLEVTIYQHLFRHRATGQYHYLQADNSYSQGYEEMYDCLGDLNASML